jgi:GDPmannose 4,6-dehydratase
VSRRISRTVAAIHRGHQSPLTIGNLDAERDWGHARDYVDGMWRMLQQDVPGDYVLATGESHSVRQFIERAFDEIGRTIAWEGHGAEEIGRDAKDGRILVRVDPSLFRPTEVDSLCGDPSKARQVLGWSHKVGFLDLVREMVRADIAAFPD